MRPKKGVTVQLRGLVAKPELNGCVGVVTKPYDPKSGRCRIRLDDGTIVNAKTSNIVICDDKMISQINNDAIQLKLNDPDNKRILEVALVKLKDVGGVEDPDSEDNSENDTDPKEYLNELLAVADARYNLGQYDKASSIYYTAYYITMHMGNCINNPKSFPVAHKMLQSYSKSNEDHKLQMGHGMAQQTLMMPGCPSYISQDVKDIEKSMRRKGMSIPEDIMATLRRNTATMGFRNY